MEFLGIDYAWFYTEDEWSFLGELSIIWRKKSAITRIRGIRVKPCTLPQAPETPLGVERPINLPKRIDEELESLSQMRQFIHQVHCYLGISDGMYTVSFESDDETLDEQYFSRTSDVLELLRRPLIEGVPLQSSSDVGVYFTWNPYEDIGYGELQLLQPYVERRKPYVNVIIPLPHTCQELLARTSVRVGITIGHDDEVCPLVDGSFNAHGNCWRVTLDGSCTDENLQRQFDSPLADFEVVNLMKAGGIFFEGVRYSFDIGFEEDTSSRRGYVFRESRLLARQFDMKPLPPGTFLYLDEERLVMSLSREVNSVRFTLQSTISGQIVISQNVVPPKGKFDVNLLLENFKDETIDFLGEFFKDCRNPEEMIVDFEEVLDDMKRLLKDISKLKR
ncbi:MAG: hypothetical protein ACTSSD_19895 [Candidatus Thorarchaeota archaeon]